MDHQSGRHYSSTNMGVLLQPESLSCSSPVLNSLWVNASAPTFHAPASMVCFEDVRGKDAASGAYFQPLIKDENGGGGGDDSDDQCIHQPAEKKRRLTAGQVQHLERSFEAENKLEPERKIHLAKELGLQPRQVAIWFQNRRARFKTKQLEKDFDSLKARFDRLKADHGSLLKEKEKLASEVVLLRDKLEAGYREKQIRRSEVLVDSDHSSVLETAESSQAFEPERSDFSHDDDQEEEQEAEDDELRRTLLPLPNFPKLEFEFSSCHDQDAANSCNFGFTLEDQPFCFWPY